MSGKRKDYISWDEYFMGVAVLSGMRSKDPIRRWVPALSAKITRYSRWGITDFRLAARMMNSRGSGRESL